MAELEQEPSSSGSSRSLSRARFLTRARSLTRVTASVVLAVGCASSATATSEANRVHANSDDAPLGIVTNIVDGDTLDLDIEGVTERVRLLGIDTPESVSSSTPDQCFGVEATEALRGLLPLDSRVSIERDTEARDRYGRLLLYLYRDTDQLFVNEWMVSSGYANAVAYAPNDRLAARLTLAEAGARSRGDGLWSQCDGPDQPLD